MVKSAYIHIPFCKSKCNYCSFVSFNKFEYQADYMKALAKEIDNNYEGENLKTIYFGGGTPSTLSIVDFSKIMRKFKINDNTEITVEINPDDVSYDYIRGLFDLGINRLSFGCQTFDNEILKQINRRHNSKQVDLAVSTAQNAGFKNISLDLIYGLPNQTEESFIKDLVYAIGLEVQHISLYGLKIEEGCFFYDNPPENLPDDDIQADMYLRAIETLQKFGFEHYEVSNFSKPNYNSKHNLTYWNNEEYYGFGVSAHGYKNGLRYANTSDLNEYITNPYLPVNSKLISNKEKLEEEIFLGFRKMIGIDTNQINIKYGINFEEKYCDILKKYENLKLIEKTNTGYKLTPNGILVSNVVLADFLDE
jgi:oxygen-independent coproporphyrinogen-3 oxidase